MIFSEIKTCMEIKYFLLIKLLTTKHLGFYPVSTVEVKRKNMSAYACPFNISEDM